MRKVLFIIFMVFTSIALNAQNDVLPYVEAEDVAIMRNGKGYEYMSNIDSLLRTARKFKQEPKVVTTTTRKQNEGWLNEFLQKDFIKVIGWGLATILLLYVLYRFAVSEGILKYRKQLKDDVAETDEAVETIMQEPSRILSAIEQAEQQGDYRKAIKFYYLTTLTRLQESGHIQLEKSKTNYDFLNSLSPRYKQTFAPLLQIFEYVWYGEYKPEQFLYLTMKEKFETFLKNI